MEDRAYLDALNELGRILDAQSEALTAMAEQMEIQGKVLESLGKRQDALETKLLEVMNSPEFMVHRVPAIDRNRIDYEIACRRDDDCGEILNRLPRRRKITVSLTSFPGRMHEIKYTLYSLTRQTLRPDRIVLWLTPEEFPGRELDIAPNLLELIKKWQITIGWTANQRAYNKLIPSLKAYPEDIIVTADDDIYYRPDWLETLWRDYERFGNITAHRVDRVLLDETGRVREHETWSYAERGSAAYANVGTGVGGVLYFPGCFHPDVTDPDKYLRLCPTADDLWFWAMEVLNDQRIRTTSIPEHDMICVNPMREFSTDPAEHLMAENVFRGGNERQLRQLLKTYPRLEEILQEEAAAGKLGGGDE